MGLLASFPLSFYFIKKMPTPPVKANPGKPNHKYTKPADPRLRSCVQTEPGVTQCVISPQSQSLSGKIRIKLEGLDGRPVRNTRPQRRSRQKGNLKLETVYPLK